MYAINRINRCYFDASEWTMRTPIIIDDEFAAPSADFHRAAKEEIAWSAKAGER
jgi:hypothetical protein